MGGRVGIVFFLFCFVFCFFFCNLFQILVFVYFFLNFSFNYGNIILGIQFCCKKNNKKLKLCKIRQKYLYFYLDKITTYAQTDITLNKEKYFVDTSVLLLKTMIKLLVIIFYCTYHSLVV